MTRKRRALLFVGVATLCVAVALYAQRWHYESYAWPEEIQRNTLGRVVALHSSLLERDGFSHLGQGAHRWTYRIDQENAVVRSMCGNVDMHACRWSKRSKPAPHVTQDAVFADGVLTLEESWE